MKKFSFEGKNLPKKKIEEVVEELDTIRSQAIYQYLCTKCNHITEEEFPFGEPDSSVPCRTQDCGAIAFKIIATPNVLVRHPTHPSRNGRGQG